MEAYDFVTPTPSTIRRWLAREAPERPSLRDVFGWGFPFSPETIDSSVLLALEAAGALERSGASARSSLRAARVQGRLFLHSAFPGAGEEAVFVGPDSYRFADFIRREIGKAPVRSILDVGVGAGVGAILAQGWSGAATVSASDLNPAALRLARANADHAGVPLDARQADGLAGAPRGLDLIVSNPPYVAGVSGRTYKDGGGDLGEGLALTWAKDALTRLAPGGRLLLYT
ncbi:MAG: methyltransferase, partial [Caulobacter sp.]|nr:methyltransferase [Caulobacter sp.]